MTHENKQKKGKMLTIAWLFPVWLRDWLKLLIDIFEVGGNIVLWSLQQAVGMGPQ